MGDFKQEVFSAYLEQRIILLNDTVEDDVIEKVVMPIISFNEEDDELETTVMNYKREDNPIKLYINSTGGAACEALSVISAIESSKTPIETIALGRAFSAGFFILMMGHKRSMQRYGRICYHQVQTFPPGGPHQTVGENLEESKELQRILVDLTLARTKIKKAKLQDINDRKVDWYIGAAEALALGIIDEIL